MSDLLEDIVISLADSEVLDANWRCVLCGSARNVGVTSVHYPRCPYRRAREYVERTTEEATATSNPVGEVL